MATYIVQIVADKNRNRPNKPPMFTVIETDDKVVAEHTAFEIYKSGTWDGVPVTGHWIRFYDFHLFGGGMRDTLIPGRS